MGVKVVITWGLEIENDLGIGCGSGKGIVHR